MAIPSFIIGGAAKLVSGLLGGRSRRKAERRAIAAAAAQTKADRDYARKVLLDDRAYAAALTKEQRAYEKARQAEITAGERKYAASLTAADRAHAEKVTAKDRAYLEGRLKADISQYTADRDRMQAVSNDLAERTAASRGIDFTRLRDDAVAAGYNPMTAMSMAHAYSRHVDYSLQGGVYSPGASYVQSTPNVTSHAAGSGAAPSGGPVQPPSGQVVGSHVPPGGSFSVGGSGYSQDGTPALSGGAFVADALARAADTYFSTVPDTDPLADALRQAMRTDQIVQDVRGEDYRRKFGYALTDVEPFRPSVKVGVPALRRDQDMVIGPGPAPRVADTRPPKHPFNRGDERLIPVQAPNGNITRLDKTIARRMGIQAFDTVSAGDWAEIVGEVVGEVEATAAAPSIREHSMGSNLWGKAVKVSPKAYDYARSARTGNVGLSENLWGYAGGYGY